MNFMATCGIIPIVEVNSNNKAGGFNFPVVIFHSNTFGAKAPVFTLTQRESPACYLLASTTKSNVEPGAFSFPCRGSGREKAAMSDQSVKVATCSRCFRYTALVPGRTICARCDRELTPKSAPRFLNFRMIDDRRIIPITPHGPVLAKEEWSNLKRKIDNFYNQVSYEDIDELNRQIRSEKIKSGKKKASSSEGHIYLLNVGENYKIGMSDDVHRRVAAIRTSMPFVQVNIVHYFRCHRVSKVEGALHKLFSHKRLGGEWFKLSPKEVEWFKALCNGTGYEDIPSASIESEFLEKR